MRLPEATFVTHIAVDHPEVPNPEVVRLAVEDPDYMLADPTRIAGVLASLYYCRGLLQDRFRNTALAVAVSGRKLIVVVSRRLTRAGDRPTDDTWNG